MEDDEGRSWRCSVHPTWRECGAQNVCCTEGLRSAYKQLGVAEVDLPFSIIGAYHPEFRRMMFWKLFAFLVAALCCCWLLLAWSIVFASTTFLSGLGHGGSQLV
eukprot:3566883-Amphidinium_carterae.1